jgi:putative ABC transport system ATP-binding protein
LADEPTGNLDSTRSVEIMEMLRAFNRRDGITIVMVTHEPEMAAYADRQIHFQDGRITEFHRAGDNISEAIER